MTTAIVSNQSDELERVKSKIRGLSAKTVEAGATEQEAMSASVKVGELLDLYNLELTDVILGAEKCIKDKYLLPGKGRSKLDFCVQSIGKFCDCITYYSSYCRVVEEDKFGAHAPAYVFFGLESDVKMAIYLCEIIEKSIESELKNYKLTDEIYLISQGMTGWDSRKTLSTNFYKGMANRVSDRLDAMKDDRLNEQLKHEAEKREAEANGQEVEDRSEDFARPHIKTTDIVPIHVKKSKKVKNEFEELGIKLGTAYRTSSNYNRSARAAGSKAGNRVNLNRGVNGRSQGMLT